jgi:hypothetical protein
LYPVGAIYIGTMNVCPLSALFGTWEKVSSGKVLQSADENHLPGTTIDAGLPNITGIIPNVWKVNETPSGAFSIDKDGLSNAAALGTSVSKDIKLDASDSNSIYGNSDTVQPPAFVVNIWKRTA